MSFKRNDKVVSHLLFADDMLVYCKGDEKSTYGLNDALQNLELYTGLAINKDKSKVFFSKGCKHKESIESILGVCIDSPNQVFGSSSNYQLS